MAGRELGSYLEVLWDAEPGRHIYSTVVTVMVGLLAATVAFVTSWQAYTGSLLTTSASLNTTIEQNRTQRADELRVQRSQGYDELLSAATTVRTTTNDFVRSCPAIRAGGEPPPSVACDETKLDDAVDRFQRASFRLNAIASADGKGAAIQVGAALPIRSYRFADGSLHAIDRAAFSQAYDNALRVMCLDIRTDGNTRSL